MRHALMGLTLLAAILAGGVAVSLTSGCVQVPKSFDVNINTGGQDSRQDSQSSGHSGSPTQLPCENEED